MRIFKLTVNTKKFFELTVENYEQMTHKKAPYYDLDGDKTRYYAVCPSCDNPIQIYKLYDDITRGQGLHARHLAKSVKRLAKYNQKSYLECDLSNPQRFDKEEKHNNKGKANEFLIIIKKYPDILYNYIRQIAGINFSYDTFDIMLGCFMKSNGYWYTAINKFNLPYGFLYMQTAINLYGRYLYRNSENVEEINKAIQNSKYHTVIERRIVTNAVYKREDEISLDLYVTKHQINSNEENVELRIVESKKQERKIIFKKKIPVNKVDFMNDIVELKNRKSVIETRSWMGKLQEIVDKHLEGEDNNKK